MLRSKYSVVLDCFLSDMCLTSLFMTSPTKASRRGTAKIKYVVYFLHCLIYKYKTQKRLSLMHRR